MRAAARELEPVKHGRRIALVLGALIAYFILFGFVFGWGRLRADFIPLDGSPVGPNLYASFIWVPFAALVAWIVSDLRHQTHKAELDAMHAAHLDELTASHEAHLAKVTALIAGQSADSATPADRSIPTTEPEGAP